MRAKNTMTFLIPLFSPFFGCLMPLASYKYIPLAAMEDIIFEFSLNEFAMFTGGYVEKTVEEATITPKN